jgi:hypothetical protein
MYDALSDAAHEHQFQSEVENRAKEIKQDFLVYRGIYPLTLLDRDGEFLKNHIMEGVTATMNPDTPSQRRLLIAKNYFDQQFADLRDKFAVDRFVEECLTLRDSIEDLELMVYSVAANNLERATLIFESVNDRGLHLSTLDKTKSFLMHMVYLAADEENDDLPNTIDRIQQSFGKMYNHYQEILETGHGSDIDDDNIQRYHYIQFANWSDSDEHRSSNLLETLKRDIRSKYEQDPEQCIEFIDEYTKSLEAAFLELRRILTYSEDATVAALIDRIHRLRHEVKFYPLLIAVWPMLKSPKQKMTLCKSIEIFILRVYSIGNYRRDTARSKLFRCARDVADSNETPGNEDTEDDVGSSFLRYCVMRLGDIMDDYESDDHFRRTLTSKNMYSKAASQDLRYLFYVYSKKRSEDEREPLSYDLGQMMGSKYTIEHIWPQTPKEGEYPFQSSGEYDSRKDRYDEHIDRLGNLSVASKNWNSKYGNDSYSDKKENYLRSGLWVQKEVGERYDEWSIENIENRESSLIEFVMNEWPSPRVLLEDNEASG